MPSSPRRAPPLLLSFGFRPFFLLASVYAAVAVPLWLAVHVGVAPARQAPPPQAWHGHEMLWGYAAAVVAGFLLTASANWTGRPPVRGGVLAALVGLWLAGRVAMNLPAEPDPWIAAIVDCAFLAALTTVVAAEIAAARNWRNLKVVAVLAGLALANAAFHAEAAIQGTVVYASRLGLAIVLLLVMLIGGRIVPAFTRNALLARGAVASPGRDGMLDAAATATAAAALAAWVAQADHPVVGAIYAVAAVAHAVRLSRWAGWRARRDPLVLVLHLGYAFLPAGFALAAAAAAAPESIPPTAAVHAWGAGVVGTMTLAVMTRATLGHTGRPLAASPATCAIYVLVVLAALVRIAAAIRPEPALLIASAALWSAAFAGFAAVYGRMLLNPRVPPRPQVVAIR